MSKYSSPDALRMYMLEGNPISNFEAMVLFGVNGTTAEIHGFKKAGYIIKKQKVPMIKVLARLNKIAVCRPPSDLPVREILMTEYWIQS